MRKSFLTYLFLFCFISGYAAVQDSTRYTILLTGASFASSHNGWFEIGCRHLNARAINRAVGGEAIANTANRMADSTLYSFEEFDDLDALVIMQVHDRNVFDESQLLTDYKDYPIPFDRLNYAMAFDYVIKRYISECYELRNNPKSKYYGSKNGKPAVIILSTHWHDSRVTYNTTIRSLAGKWGLPLIEFDKYIGFSKNNLYPVTGEQPSLLHAYDAETIDGIKYGKHPHRGQDKYIQQRMATVFVDLMKKVLPLK